jgi:flagellin
MPPLEKEKEMAASSGITLTSGMRKNLFSLQNTQALLERTQRRLATGQRVNTPIDDPINYFTSLVHRQRAEDLASRKDEMSESIQLIMAANEGVEGIIALLASAKSLAQSAMSAGSETEVSALQAQYNEVLTQITQMANDSGYKGTNLLMGVDVTHTVTFNGDGSSFLEMTGFEGTAAGLDLIVATDWVGTGGPDKGAILDHIALLDDARTTLRTEAQKLSTNLSTITIRQDFTKGMINTLEDGAAELINADMNEEGANMLMLQTRQALGTTSLALASQAAQSILRLF